MASYNPLRLTPAGKVLFAKVYANTATTKFTKVASGCGAYEENEDYADRTELKDKKQEFPIGSMDIINRENVQLNLILYNYGITKGYNITEIGLYAYDPDVGEILYAVMTAQEGMWDYFPAYTEIRTATISLKLIVAVSDTDKITIQVDEEAFVTRKEYNAKVIELENMIADGIAGSGTSYILPVAAPKKLGGVLSAPFDSKNMDLPVGVTEDGRMYAGNPAGDFSIGFDKDGTICLLYKGNQIGNSIKVGGGTSSGIDVPDSEEDEVSGEPETEYTKMSAIVSLYDNAYIDTGMVYDADKTTIEYDFALLFHSYYDILRAQDPSKFLRFRIENQMDFHIRIGYWEQSVYVIERERKYKVKLDKGCAYLDGAKMWDADAGKTGEYIDFTTSGNITLGHSCRTYGCRIWNDGILVRDLIPVKDPSGILCMYDLCNNKYHYSAGEGQFK